jgi:hypothetical protein
MVVRTWESRIGSARVLVRVLAESFDVPVKGLTDAWLSICEVVLGNVASVAIVRDSRGARHCCGIC